MTKQSYYEGISHTVYLSSNLSFACGHCGHLIDNKNIGDSINHYLKDHGYRLLHVGQDTGTGDDGKPFYSTVAVVGI